VHSRCQRPGQRQHVRRHRRNRRCTTTWATGAIPRAQWAETEKSVADDQKILDQAIASGTIVAYGNDTNLVQGDGYTHDDWWSSMSMAGVLNVFEQFYKAGNSSTAVLSSATKHSDSIYVSRYYNWRAGSWKGAVFGGTLWSASVVDIVTALAAAGLEATPRS